MVIKMNKAEALKMYQEVFMAQGEHNGRWEDEYSQEGSAITYKDQMIEFAEELNLEFDHNPMSYADEEDMDKAMIFDCMGFELRQMIEKKLRDIILA